MHASKMHRSYLENGRWFLSSCFVTLTRCLPRNSCCRRPEKLTCLNGSSKPMRWRFGRCAQRMRRMFLKVCCPFCCGMRRRKPSISRSSRLGSVSDRMPGKNSPSPLAHLSQFPSNRLQQYDAENPILFHSKPNKPPDSPFCDFSGFDRDSPRCFIRQRLYFLSSSHTESSR